MAAILQLRRQSLSVSLPDVSCEGASLSGSNQNFIPLPLLTSTPSLTNYNIDDDRWADKMDANTGSVFFVDPQNTVDTPLARSYSSCSSLSSMTSDLPYAPSPTNSLRSESFSEKFSRSLHMRPKSSSLDRYPSTPEPTRAEEGMYVPETAVLSRKKTSSLKKLKRAFKKKKLRGSGSLSDLNEVIGTSHIQSLPSFSEGESTSPSTPNTVLPETTLYGSGGIPLTPTHSISGRGRRGSAMTRVTLDLSQFGLGAGLTPCSLERLGIVPSRSLLKGKFGSTISLKYPKYPSTSDLSQPVLIRGVVPGSPAAVTQHFFSGDTIHFVESHRINVDNIDTVLGGLSSKIQFLLEKGYQRPRSSLPPSTGPSAGGLVRLVSGVKDVVRSHSHPSHPHTSLLLYLTLDTQEDDPPGSDILYQWPRGGEQDSLVQVRGLFLTLADLLGEITASKSFCSTVTVEGELFHLGYIKYSQELLLLALPAKIVTQYQVQLLAEKVSSIVELLYGSVTNGFTIPSAHWSLDHLLALIFDSVTTPTTSDFAHPLLMVVPQLKLPADVKVRLSAALSGLDSANHSNRPEVLHQRRPFFVLGSCLFYKGALACSHLGYLDQKDIVELANAYRLPELTASDSISQIVIWKQVFLSRLKTCVDTASQQNHFALLVGLENMFVCVLMEATTPFPSHAPPTVDAVYVDQARSLIMELRTQHLLSECEEKGLPSTPLPSLTTADIALASKFTRRSSISLAPLPPTAPSRRRKTSEPSILSSPLSPHIRLIAADSSDSDDPTTKSSPVIHRRTQSLISGKRKKSQPVETLVAKGVVPRQPYMLTSGADNILLHYVHLTPGRGVMLCPTHFQPGPVHSELLHTFRETSLTLRQTLWGRVEAGVTCVESDSESDDEWEEEEEDTKNDKMPAVSPFSPQASSVVEHGILVQCGIHSVEKHKSSPVLNYWVVGRLFGEGENRTELYVCYQENVAQDTVEMAYRLLFGWTG